MNDYLLFINCLVFSLAFLWGFAGLGAIVVGFIIGKPVELFLIWLLVSLILLKVDNVIINKNGGQMIPPYNIKEWCNNENFKD